MFGHPLARCAGSWAALHRAVLGATSGRVAGSCPARHVAGNGWVTAGQDGVENEVELAGHAVGIDEVETDDGPKSVTSRVLWPPASADADTLPLGKLRLSSGEPRTLLPPMVTERGCAHRRGMTTHRITTALGLVLSAATIVSACGGDGNGGSDSAADGPYCKTVRNWTAHQMSSIDESDPAQLEKYIGEYVAFITDAAEEAPAEIATDWKWRPRRSRPRSSQSSRSTATPSTASRLKRRRRSRPFRSHRPTSPQRRTAFTPTRRAFA